MEAGLTEPTSIQLKTLTRINGGQDVVAIGPDGCGKTTTYILSVLNRLKYNVEGVPVVLILVPDKEKVLDVISRFERLNKNQSFRIVGLYAAPGTEGQMSELAEGADIVVATPDRARAIYLKLGLNLNKIELLVIDDAELIVKQGLQLPVAELANSITKCQHLVFTTVVHEKLNKMIEPFMRLPAVVEVNDEPTIRLNLIPQVLYHVPNFGTKLNLLTLFMDDKELFNKTIVFVNTLQTAEKIYRELQNKLKQQVALLGSSDSTQKYLEVDDFRADSGMRVLIALNQTDDTRNFYDVPFLLHFDLPADENIFIDRVLHQPGAKPSETLSLLFATDLELSMVKKIEHVTGQKIPLADLPDELNIVKERKIAGAGEQAFVKKKESEPEAGAAFHEKKPGNAKTYNYGGGQKAKMNNKRKHQ